MAHNIKTISLLMHSLLISGTLATVACYSDADLGSAAQSLESQLCGNDERTHYDLACDELAVRCDGDFICYDAEPSRDGSCLSWGECVPGETTTSTGVEPEEIDAPAAEGVEPEEIDAPAAEGVEPEEIDAL